MAQVLTQTLPGDLAFQQQQYNQAQTQAAAPVAPMFTPDQIAARKALNEQQYKWGLMGAMMGDEQQARAGGAVLQQALADRGERVTDKGVFNPLTGQMSVNTQYATERAQDAAERAGERFGSAQSQYGSQQRSEAAARALQGSSQAFQAGQNTLQRQNALDLENLRIKQAAVAAGKGQPSEDEGKSAGFALRMKQSHDIIKNFDKPQTVNVGGEIVHYGSGRPTRYSNAMTAIGMPNIGTDAAQQQYRNAQDDWLAANARAESGANIREEEMDTFRKIYFPQPGEDEATARQKEQKREAAETAMMQRGGRAWAPIQQKWAADQAAQAQAALPKLNYGQVPTPGAPQAQPVPAAPTSMLPRVRAAMNGQPDPFASQASPYDYGG